MPAAIVGQPDHRATYRLDAGPPRRLFGGDSPELLDRLRPLLDKFGTDLEFKYIPWDHIGAGALLALEDRAVERGARRSGAPRPILSRGNQAVDERRRWQ